jgi:hypothetical protein
MSTAERLATLKSRLARYYDAETKVREANQRVETPDGMIQDRGQLSQIRHEIRALESQIAYLEDNFSVGMQTFVFPGRR